MVKKSQVLSLMTLVPLLMLSSGCVNADGLSSTNAIIKDSSGSEWPDDGDIFEDGQTFVLTISNSIEDIHGIQGGTLIAGREVPWVVMRQPRSRYDVNWLRILEHEGRHASGRPFIKHNGTKCPCTGYERSTKDED